jgi:hypothetical protein
VLEIYAVHAGTAVTFAGSNITGGDVGYVTASTGIHSLSGGSENKTTVNITSLAESIDAIVEEGLAPRDNTTDILPAIGGLTFTPGTFYGSTLSIVAGATVTLDAQGDPDAVFFFQAETTMLIGAGCSILLINGAQAQNVNWAIGTTLTVGADAHIEGSIVAGTAIVFGARTVVRGVIVAGTALTFGATTLVDGSVVAGTAVTFGATTQVNGSVVALTSITFGAGNHVTIPADTIPVATPFATPSNSPSSSPDAAPIIGPSAAPISHALHYLRGCG